jgi:uncharacterized membrane protein HdeD (DUF308 family)
LASATASSHDMGGLQKCFLTNERLSDKPCAHSLNSALTKSGPKLRQRPDLGKRYEGLAISPPQNHHVIALAALAKRAEKGGSVVTSSSDFRRPRNLGPGVEALRAEWGWIVALGTIYVLVGLIALYSVVTATIASVFVVGIMMLIAGVAEVINAFQVKSWGKFFLWILLGVLYILAGFVTFENPLLAAALLTLVLGAALVASGIMRIILAVNMMEGTPWIAVVFSGVVTFLLGLIILAHWPVSSLYVLGLFLGIDLVFAGGGWIGVGIGLKGLAYEAHYKAGHEAGRAEGYEAGQKAGHEAGHAEGYEAGQKAGHEAGHAEGYEAGQKAGHEAGHAEGYEAGQKAGHEAGRAEGYEAGQKAGRDEAMTPPEPPPSTEA